MSNGRGRADAGACVWGVAVLMALAGCGTDAPQGSGESRAVPLWRMAPNEASAPVVAWLRAVKDKDPRLLARALSTRVKTKLGDVDWAGLIGYYERILDSGFGAWRVEDFVLAGIEERVEKPGAATVQCLFSPPGRPAVKMSVGVVREGVEWRMDVFPQGYVKRATP